MLSLLKETLSYVLGTLWHNSLFLILGISVAAIIKVYINPEKFRQALMKRANVSIPGSVAFGAFTPFCACGTMAVVISMLTTALPWGPIMAFLISSPLMSPDEFIMFSGIISFRFAVALAVASIIIGLGAGYITHFIEKRTKFLENQARFAEKKEIPLLVMSATKSDSFGCSSDICTTKVITTSPSGTFTSTTQKMIDRFKLKELFKIFYEVGIKKILLYFAIFAAVGFMINKFVPMSWIIKYLGSGNSFAVPFSSLIGLPLYVSGSSSIPLINTLLEGGASGGAMLAFMITGPGTSAGVIAGITTIMRKRAIALYVTYLLVGAIVLGYLYDFLLMLGM